MRNRRASENRKEKIFEAALQCFNKKGYYKTSIDDIASRCKISKGGIYYQLSLQIQGTDLPRALQLQGDKVL